MHTFEPLSPEDARAIARWRYPGRLAAYDIPEDELESSITYMTDRDNGFFGVHRGGQLIGFCSLGADGQVPGGMYDEAAVDVGAGMRPDLIGKGDGGSFLRDVMEFAMSVAGNHSLRATIASWNDQALRVARAVGFEPRGSFTSSNGSSYTILVLERDRR
jgi:[ribosomal protein S18]-alanine N-acetyltransferase